MDELTAHVLAMDLDNLSAADFKWLHDLSGKAMVEAGRLQLERMRQKS